LVYTFSRLKKNNSISLFDAWATQSGKECQNMTRFFPAIMMVVFLFGAFFSCWPVIHGVFSIENVIDESGLRVREWLSKRATTAATIHSSGFAVWQVYDTNAYLKYKKNIDSLMLLFDRAVPVVVKDLGVTVPLPVQVNIDSGDCCGGWAALNSVGFRIENFNSNAVFPNCDGFTAPDWTRGVIIGEFANHAAAVGSSGCQPRDWWVDGVWNFPDMVVAAVLAEVLDSTAARYWEQHMDCSDLVKKPLYMAFKDLRLKHGWQAFQNAFKAIREDSISFCSGFTNPSALLTNYTLAYLSLGAGENIAGPFKAAGADGADSAVVKQILSARKSLRDCPDQAGGSAARQAYLSGNYQAVNICSPHTFCRFGDFILFSGEKALRGVTVGVTDISGRVMEKCTFDQAAPGTKVSAFWRGKNTAKPGVYFVRISLGNQSFIRKIVKTE
jgi:hypothetical protein